MPQSRDQECKGRKWCSCRWWPNLSVKSSAHPLWSVTTWFVDNDGFMWWPDLRWKSLIVLHVTLWIHKGISSSSSSSNWEAYLFFIICQCLSFLYWEAIDLIWWRNKPRISQIGRLPNGEEKGSMGFHQCIKWECRLFRLHFDYRQKEKAARQNKNEPCFTSKPCKRGCKILTFHGKWKIYIQPNNT